MSNQGQNCFGSHPGQEPSSSNLIINYLPQKLTDQEFHDMFAKIGAIKTCKIVRNKQTGYSYGFGFVDYHNPEDAQEAITKYNGFRIDNKTLKVAIAKPSDSDHSKNANVYIRGVPKTFDSQELEDIFSQFGRMVQFRVLRDESHSINKGVAFALYDEIDNAERAIREMDGKTLNGGIEALTVKLADDQLKLKKQRQMNMVDTHNMAPSGVSGGPRGVGGPGGPMYGRPYVGFTGRPNHRFNPMTKGGAMYDYASPPPNGQSSGYVLFAYNIGTDTDDNSLYDLFSQYGTVEKATALKDKATGKGKGYGFVTMTVYDEAVWAIENLTGFHYAGKPLQVSFKSGKNNMGGTGGMGNQGGHVGGFGMGAGMPNQGMGQPSNGAGDFASDQMVDLGYSAGYQNGFQPKRDRGFY